MTQKLIIAGIDILMQSPTEYSRFFADYAADYDGNSDITVSVSSTEIAARHDKFPELSEQSAELTLLYEKICDELPRFDAYMLHAATIEYGGCAYAFCARSGTGKSTHAALWKSMLGDRCRYINCDKPVIRITEGVPTAYGSPWSGKELLGENTSAPLAGICFLVRSEVPSIRKIEPKESVLRLLSAAHKPKDGKLEDAFYDCIGRTVSQVPMYELQCNISAEAATLSFETMTGDKM